VGSDAISSLIGTGCAHSKFTALKVHF